jgi:hypothetical protein
VLSIVPGSGRFRMMRLGRSPLSSNYYLNELA